MQENGHIVYISPGFALDEEDGYCMPYFQNLLSALKRQCPQLRISVIALQYPYHNKPYQWKGISIYPCGGDNIRFPKRLRVWQQAKRYFKHLHQEQPVDYLHSFWLSECALLGNRWGKKWKIPHLVSLMGQDALPTNRYQQWIDQSFPTLIAVSNYQAKTFQETTGREVAEIIPHGHDLDNEVHPFAEDRDIDILGVGSLIPLKQYDWFIDAVALAQKKHPRIKAVVLGEGPEQKRLEARVAELGLQKHLQFKGLVNRKEVLEHLGRARVLAHPSAYEAYGFVFAEALWQGARVVSQAVGIAHPLPKWQLVDSKQDFVQAVSNALEEDVDISRVSLDSAKETAQKYWNHYSKS